MMLNTSSSEEENPQFSAKYSGSSTDAHSRWQNHEFKNMRTLDLRSRRSEYDADQKLRSEPDSAKFARIPLGGASSSSCGWQPLKVESGGRSELLPNEPQRAPRLYTIAGARTSVAEQGYPHEVPSGMEDVTAKNYQFNQFSSSFEGNSESGPIGTRLSPIGSSCWSSEQHISPDLASLVSGSTNSFSAGRSTSSGKQPYVTSSLTQHLQRQHSGVYSGVILSHEPYSIQSASQSVRSAPLCITANQTHPICARQLTIDVSDSINDNPTPPSLLVSDPEEEAHKRILQLYVFASRCIAYPVLNPVYPGPSRRYLKVTKDYLLTLKERIQLFLKGEYPINCDEAFQSAVGDFFEVVLESDRIASMVKSGACSMYDIREIFIAFIEKRFQNEHVNEGLSKENVIGSWKVKFDQICRGGERPCPVAMKLAVPQPEIVAPTKEQQYDLLMRTLSVEKYEHQVLYNACQILIHQLRNVLQMSASKKLYFTIELEGSSEKKRTDSVEAAKPLWNTTAEFQTHQPLPVIRLRLYKECSGALALEDKELGRLTLHPSWLTTRAPTWFRLQANKHCHDTLEVQLTVSMQRPANCRYANYCWIQGRTAFKKWKRRYLCLIQVSQYTFVIAAYAEQKSHPSEFMALDGFTVDYCENRPDLVFASSSVRSKPEHHMSATSLTSLSKLRFGGFGRLVHQHRAESAATMCGPEPELKATYFLKLVREGDTVIMATSTDADRQSWIQTIYRATGQTHKPAIPNHLTIGTPTRLFTGESEAGHATGIEELASKPPHAFCHVELFTELQARSLSYRLQDSFVSLGWLSPGQKILLEEYCSRYGIRECQRHLAYLTSLLDKAEHGMKVDPDLLHISYSICANHVTGKT
ncbi:unnamed protein product [Dicrocoelium dendriticum]|nr:unnamed protein product [Dicrocoelium dendriticum]